MNSRDTQEQWIADLAKLDSQLKRRKAEQSLKDLRDQIAIRAMQGIIQTKEMPNADYAAKYAYQYADAMLAVREYVNESHDK
jgi:hypothetical protein